MWVLGMKLGPLKEPPMLLTTEPLFIGIRYQLKKTLTQLLAYTHTYPIRLGYFGRHFHRIIKWAW